MDTTANEWITAAGTVKNDPVLRTQLASLIRNNNIIVKRSEMKTLWRRFLVLPFQYFKFQKVFIEVLLLPDTANICGAKIFMVLRCVGRGVCEWFSLRVSLIKSSGGFWSKSAWVYSELKETRAQWQLLPPLAHRKHLSLVGWAASTSQSEARLTDTSPPKPCSCRCAHTHTSYISVSLRKDQPNALSGKWTFLQRGWNLCTFLSSQTLAGKLATWNGPFVQRSCLQKVIWQCITFCSLYANTIITILILHLQIPTWLTSSTP